MPNTLTEKKIIFSRRLFEGELDLKVNKRKDLLDFTLSCLNRAIPTRRERLLPMYIVFFSS